MKNVLRSTLAVLPSWAKSKVLVPIISTDAQQAVSVHTVDLDGNADVLSASEGYDKIAWYEN